MSNYWALGSYGLGLLFATIIFNVLAAFIWWMIIFSWASLVVGTIFLFVSFAGAFKDLP